MELKINSFIGSMNEEIDITKDGKDILIGFNPKFFIDALRVIDEEEVTLYMVNPKAPCFIRDENETFIYLILPVNFNAAANQDLQRQEDSGVTAKLVILDEKVKVNGEVEVQRGKKLYDGDVVEALGETIKIVK